MKVNEVLKRAFLPRLCILCGDVIDYDLDEPFCDKCRVEWLKNLDIMCDDCGFDCDICGVCSGGICGVACCNINYDKEKIDDEKSPIYSSFGGDAWVVELS